MKIRLHALVMLVPLVMLGLAWKYAVNPEHAAGVTEPTTGSGRLIAPANETATPGGWDEWLAAYEAEPDNGDLRKVGRAMAEERSRLMEEWMRTDPDRALRAAFPYGFYRQLPGFVSLRIERPFHAATNLDVIVGCPEEGIDGGVMNYRVGIDGIDHEVFPVRGRAGVTSKRLTSLSGIRLDRLAVVDGKAVRVLKESEALDAAAVLGVPLEEGEGVPVLVAGRIVRMEMAAADELARAFERAERLPGPETTAAMVATLEGGADSNSLEEAMAAIDLASTSWTASDKRMLFIRLDFSDIPGDPVPLADLRNTIDECAQQFTTMSYGKVALVTTVSSRIYRLGSSAEFAGDYSLLANRARELAAADHNLNAQDILVYCFPQIYPGWAGMAMVGGRDQWLNGYFSRLVIVHETGHNYGLGHANWWRVNEGENPAAASGTSMAYGDPYDSMGNIHAGGFGIRSRAGLAWTDPGEHIEVSQPGLYRLHRFDNPSASGAGRVLGLRLRREAEGRATHDYWLGYRREATVYGNQPTGVQVIRDMRPVWYSSVSEGTWLLDMTPGSNTSSYFDRRDAFLEVGRSFIDPEGLVTVTAVASGGTGGDEWIDVSVAFGAEGNLTPVVRIEGPGDATPGSTVTLTAVAEDPDGDSLSFQWDTGDGWIAGGAERTVAIPAWQGKMPVKVRVYDGRGASATAVHVISLGGLADWPGGIDSNLRWGTPLSAGWSAIGTVGPGGMQGLESGTIGHNQQSWATAVVAGPGTLSFMWKVSSEANYDFLRFRLNGAELPHAQAISGERGWERVDVELPAGTHLLRWSYEKDYSVVRGADRGWLGGVVFTPREPVKILSFTKVPVGMALSFETRPARTYRIETSPDLKIWTVAESGIAGTGSPVSRLLPFTGPRGFVRIGEN